MATEILCPHCQAVLGLSAVDGNVQVELKQAPEKKEAQDDESILAQVIGAPDDDE